MGYADAAYQRGQYASEDVLGMDRLGRALLRLVGQMAPGTLIGLHGAPGSGKEEFLARLAWLASETGRGAQRGGVSSHVVWYNPWTYAKQGNILAGLLAHVAQVVPNGPGMLMERARDGATYLGRLHFDTTMAKGFGSVLAEGGNDPIDRVQRDFFGLVEGVKASAPGRLLIIVTGLDDLSPALRWQFIDGVRLMLQSGADATIILSIGREAALAAIRHREGELSEATASRDLDGLLDLSMTVPNLDARRIGHLLQRSLGEGASAVNQSFGASALNNLLVAVSHRPLGTPRFLQRLATRVVLLAEFAAEVRGVREISEVQWAWVVVSERWPEFRRFMIRGGGERWMELKRAISLLSRGSEPGAARGAGELLDGWLQRDPLLAEYLSRHAEGFERELEAVFWMENLMLAAGV